MEWLFVVILALILVGPILWALTFGRRGRGPASEDEPNVTGFAWLIRESLEKGPTGGGGRG